MWNASRLISFVLLWSLATAVGHAVGLFLGTIIGFPLSYLFNPLGLAMIGAILGAIVGLGQWLVLRFSVGVGWARNWVLFSAPGGLGGFLLGYVLVPIVGVGNVVHGLVLGGGLGLAQWAILRQVGPYAVGWVVISSVTLGIVWNFSIGIFANGGMLRLALQSLIYGISTALFLAWFLRVAPDTAERSS